MRSNHPHLRVAVAAAAMSIASTSVMPVEAAPGVPDSRVEQVLAGQVGPYRIGVNLTIQDRHILVAGHYYYARKPIDIPLSGDVTGETVTLREPGGGIFRLHFETSDKSAPHPLDFGTSTALVGTWSGNGRVFPVRLAFDFSGGPQGSSRYQDITREPAALFETRVRRFVHGVTTGNRTETASAVSYPLRVNGAKPLLVRNRTQLLALWARIFPPCYVDALRSAVPHEMFVRNGSAMVANGAAWFGARGATTLNVPDCHI